MASYKLLCVSLLALVFISSTVGQCPGSLTKTATATIQTINYPGMGKYGPNMNCQWNISTSIAGEVVHFQAVDMSLAPNCNDKVEIYDGDLATRIQLGCGSDTFAVQSTKQFTIVKFTSDALRQGYGFKLNYWSAKSYSDACEVSGGPIAVSDTPVILNLPNVGTAAGTKTCRYTFTASSADYVLTLSFKPWKQTKALMCKYGKMTVYDGAGTDGLKMYEGCPSQRPFWDLDSSGQSITVVIVSTYAGQDMARFSLRAQQLMIKDDCKNAMPIGYIESYIWFPTFKEASGKYCVKTITAPYENVARVDAMYQLKSKKMISCSDSVPFTVNDGKVGKECYHGTTTFMNKTNTMMLNPKTAATENDRVLLKVTSFGCQKKAIVVKTDKLNDSSPMYPMEYPLESVCTWQFVSYRPDYVIVLEVLESDLPEDCTDFVSVIDGEYQTDKKLGEWCGNRKQTYRGTGQVMTLTFQTRGTTKTGHKGFRFRYYADTPIARETDAGTNVLLIAAILTIIVIVGGLIFITYKLCATRKAKKGDQHPLTE